MTLDLDLDLRHLDDPEPPVFGPVWAGEAARRAADRRARKARVVAAAVMSVSLVAGIGAISLSRGGKTDITTAADTPATAEPPPPEETAFVPTTVPAVVPVPSDAVPGGGGPAALPVPAPTVPSTTPAQGGAGPSGPSGPATTFGPAPGTAMLPPPARATGQPPSTTVPAPPDLPFSLTFDSTRVAAGGSLTAHVRFENTRTTPVTLVGGGCSMWHANLYDGGRAVTGTGPTCPMRHRKVVAPGGVEEASAMVDTDAQLRPGTYDAFTTIRVEELDAALHTARVVVEVVRP